MSIGCSYFVLIGETTDMRPIGIDLFAGAGGLSLGFEQAGFDVAAAVEIDPVHCATHEFNFPGCATICRDVSKVSGREIRAAAGIGTREIDVVFGGAPCQGFSMIGQRALDDPRNSLVKHYVRIVREIAPKYFVFENVKGLTLGKHKKFLDELIQSLSRDYDVLMPYRVLNAAEHGVPQDRRRLFLIGARKGLTVC
jgi:DNA (cytosine-5)-methyltransferase 1